MTTLKLSVIVCTHNPRKDYLERVLQALKTQSLSQESWELLLIDNASNTILASEVDLSWHSNAKHIREETLGLTPARLRGIREASAEALIFVDDDNVLGSDYLEIASKISEDFPFLGTWGGRITPQFEKTPPDWTKPYWQYLAIREFEQDKWSNLLHQHETTPCGAGLCVRKIVAEKYAEVVRSHPERAGLDRRGKLLISCGDSDLAFTACDIGLGTGMFVSLHLIHLMPSNRLEEDYLLRLTEGIHYSITMLESFRGKIAVPEKVSLRGRLREHYQLLKMSARDRRFYQVSQRGRAQALQEVLKIQKNVVYEVNQLNRSENCA